MVVRANPGDVHGTEDDPLLASCGPNSAIILISEDKCSAKTNKGPTETLRVNIKGL
jgi:hypothetical protein